MVFLSENEWKIEKKFHILNFKMKYIQTKKELKTMKKIFLVGVSSTKHKFNQPCVQSFHMCSCIEIA